jgi:glycosyltransferase involved in cell wall biosynthesis
MGAAELGRVLINQLVHAGIEVAVCEIPVQGSEADTGGLGEQALRLLGGGEAAEVNIVNTVPPMFAQYRLPGARNIGCSMFEADRLPAAWVEQCNQMDAMWVPSQWGRDMFVASGVRVPVFVVGVDAQPTPVHAPAQGPFRMLSIFQWTPRKNPVALLRAYCAAFDGDSDTVLTLKAHWLEDEQQSAAFVQRSINQVMTRIKPRRALPRVEVATRFFSRQQVQQMHAESHAYVSLSHGESWGLPAWEATLAGKPVIHTAWSAPNEFVHEQGRVRCNLTPVYGMREFSDFYDSGMNWAEPHLDDAVARMRDLRDNYATWTRNSRSQRDVMNNRYSLARRLEQLKTALR